MKTYLLKIEEDNLHLSVKKEAMEQGMNMNDLMLLAVRVFLAQPEKTRKEAVRKWKNE